jgi:ribosomal protein S27AE
MKLTKQIPARRETIKFRWIREFQPAAQLNNARSRIGMSTFQKCYWCKHPFDGDEMTFLAGHKGKNRILCGKCADEAFANE